MKKHIHQVIGVAVLGVLVAGLCSCRTLTEEEKEQGSMELERETLFMSEE